MVFCVRGEPNAGGEVMRRLVGQLLLAVLLPRNCIRSLRNRGGEDLAGVAVDEAESEGGGALAEATQHPRALLDVVGVGPGVPIDELPLQGAIDERGELASGRGEGLRFADAGGEPPVEGPE